MSASPRHLVCLILLLACLAPASTAAAAERPATPWFGFNDLSSVSGAVPFDTAALAAATAGASSTRLTIDWSWVQPAKGSWSWGMFDGVYWRSLARGVRPLIGITGAPRWAWDASATCATSSCAYPPGRDHDADYRELVRQLVRRYPRAVGIEVGNEPNLGWAWAGGVDPARYTELLKVAHDAVKSVDPGMPVIAGALAPVLSDVANPGTVGLRPFLQAMYDNGARGNMDAISIHPYPYGVNFSSAFKALDLAKETRTANGDDVPLWATELGLTTSGSGAATEYEQAITLPALYSALRGDGEIDGIYVHSLIENPLATVNGENAYGVLRADLAPKPAYCTLAAARAASYTCPKGVAAAVPTGAQQRRWEAQVILKAAADAARTVHQARGGYRDVTAADLHAVDARVSATGPAGDVVPGAGADPSKVGVYPVTDGRDGVLLCNASRADRSYCIYTFWRGAHSYGSVAGSLYASAGATTKGASTSW